MIFFDTYAKATFLQHCRDAVDLGMEAVEMLQSHDLPFTLDERTHILDKLIKMHEKAVAAKIILENEQ